MAANLMNTLEPDTGETKTQGRLGTERLGRRRQKGDTMYSEQIDVGGEREERQHQHVADHPSIHHVFVS
jgi:hypothetical protein